MNSIVASKGQFQFHFRS